MCNAAIMPAGYGIGDHCLFVIDFAELDVIGILRQKVIRPTSRHLNTKIPRVAADYARILEEKVLSHRLIEQMGKAHCKCISKELAIRRLNKLNEELGQYMRYAEKKCRRIKLGRIPFSPEASLWIRRTQVYRPTQVPRRANKEQRQPQTGSTAMPNHRCHVPHHRGNFPPP